MKILIVQAICRGSLLSMALLATTVLAQDCNQEGRHIHRWLENSYGGANCGRTISQTDAEALWSGYCEEDCSISLNHGCRRCGLKNGCGCGTASGQCGSWGNSGQLQSNFGTGHILRGGRQNWADGSCGSSSDCGGSCASNRPGFFAHHAGRCDHQSIRIGHHFRGQDDCGCTESNPVNCGCGSGCFGWPTQRWNQEGGCNKIGCSSFLCRSRQPRTPCSACDTSPTPAWHHHQAFGGRGHTVASACDETSSGLFACGKRCRLFDRSHCNFDACSPINSCVGTTLSQSCGCDRIDAVPGAGTSGTPIPNAQ